MSRPLLPALLFALVLAALPAHAQQNNQQNKNTPYGSYVQDLYGSGNQDNDQKPATWQYDKKYRMLGKGPAHNFKTGTNPLPLGMQQIYLVRKEGLKNNEAALRMMTPVSLGGCINVAPPVIKMRKSANMLILNIEDGVISVNKKPQYGHFQCDSGSHTASADLILNRDELIQDNIRSLSFQASNGAMDVYDVKVTPDRLTLVPRSTVAFVPYAASTKLDPLVYDFYPDNLVILYASSAPEGADLSAQITTLAQSKGLVESTVLKNGRGLYFIDRTGALAGTLAFDANAFIGTVRVEETYQGPDGPYQQARAVDVYAKRPGTLD
ncbi:MAG: hypothetical protein DYH13_10105 [Alphaproteobacteria bacterium PRO2]|nr:hypothetical protein [Alphaproteobacteria bacterium PRO2]